MASRSPSARRGGFARWWLLALLAAVFPANIYMALKPEEVAERGVPADRIPRWALYGRLPLQFVCVAVWGAGEARAGRVAGRN